jgi:hypothetical protein
VADCSPTASGTCTIVGTLPGDFPGLRVLNQRSLQLNIDEQTPVSEINRKFVELSIPVEGIDVKKGLEEWFMNLTNEK